MAHFNVGIRPYQPGDAPLLYEAARESIAEIYPWMHWCHPDYALQDSIDWIASCMTAWNEKRAFDFVASDRDSGQFLGAVGINQINPIHLFANLGYWVRTSCTGHRVAAAATLQAARFGFDELGLKRIEIVAAVGNLRSQRVAEKVGATREGVLRQRLRVADVWHDAVMFSLIPDDLKAVIV